MHNDNRRKFLKSSATLAAGVSLFGMPGIVRAGANDRIRVAVVGLGGRGQNHVQAIHQLATENVDLAALCDCDEANLNQSGAAYEKLSGRRAALVGNLRKLLDDRSIDAMTFATPNHWHSLGAIWACQAGKDVYVEKPGSHNIFEGRRMVETARKYRRIVQHGTQCRSSPNIREGVQRLREGVIGKVYLARAVIYKIRGAIGRLTTQPVPKGLNWDAWLGPAPEHPYSSTRRRGWHYLWDFGNGQLGNQGVHQMDLIRWGLGLDTHPTHIQSMGGRYTHDDDQQTPDTQTCSYQFAGRDLLVEVEVRNWYTNTEAGMGERYPFVDHQSVVGVLFLGREGYMLFPDYSSYYIFLGKDRRPGPNKSIRGEPMMDAEHFRNWIAAVRSRKTSDLVAEIEEGHLSSALCHLANIAYRARRTVVFDAKAERFPGDEEANGLLRREYRAPYVVSEKP
ncbi:MAG: Gfo/Idh/MocA family protein [Thermoguttaceae bacterium]